MAEPDYSNCTISTCDITTTWYKYQPGLAINATLLALFITGLLLHTILGIGYRTWGFWIAITFGCSIEVLGYAGRVYSHFHPWALGGFLIQIVSLALAPAFFAAGIYLCLARIIIAYGANLSRFQPKVYTYIFIFCDTISLIVQGTGGGLSSTSAVGGNAPTLGGNITLAGIVFQVFTLTMWVVMAADFAWRAYKAGPEAWDPKYKDLRESSRFKGFLTALGVALLTVYIRSVYRIAELSQGYGSPLDTNEVEFCVLEGVMITIATYSLIVCHPGFGFGIRYKHISAEKKSYPRPWKKGGIFMEKKDGGEQDPSWSELETGSVNMNTTK